MEASGFWKNYWTYAMTGLLALFLILVLPIVIILIVIMAPFAGIGKLIEILFIE